ncbi:hypothetical protein BGZ94_000947 [Podila epigama]|nr:hypothetical protein BGZ94_000947 [Podila epigama]
MTEPKLAGSNSFEAFYAKLQPFYKKLERTATDTATEKEPDVAKTTEKAQHPDESFQTLPEEQVIAVEQGCTAAKAVEALDVSDEKSVEMIGRLSPEQQAVVKQSPAAKAPEALDVVTEKKSLESSLSLKPLQKSKWAVPKADVKNDMTEPALKVDATQPTSKDGPRAVKDVRVDPLGVQSSPPSMRAEYPQKFEVRFKFSTKTSSALESSRSKVDTFNLPVSELLPSVQPSKTQQIRVEWNDDDPMMTGIQKLTTMQCAPRTSPPRRYSTEFLMSFSGQSDPPHNIVKIKEMICLSLKGARTKSKPFGATKNHLDGTTKDYDPMRGSPIFEDDSVDTPMAAVRSSSCVQDSRPSSSGGIGGKVFSLQRPREPKGPPTLATGVPRGFQH